MPIVYRLVKGSPLTHAELDGNFQFLTGSINAISGTYATTGSNTFNGNQTVYGNLSVFGTASFTFTTSSVTEISASTFGINIFSPTIRFGRYDVYDTGDTVSTSSFVWDSGNTRWIYLRTTGSVSSSAIILTGPLGSSGPGNETVIPQYRIPMSNGDQSLVSSNIYTSGSTNIITGSTFIYSFASYPTPTLGTGSGGFFLGGDNGVYGLYMGVSSSGTTWLQSNRNDGTAAAYNISLQPVGGNVNIGKFNPDNSGPKLDVSGSTLITGSVGILGNTNINGTLNATSITSSLLGTSSYASQALSSSYAAQALTASFALTASYAANVPTTSSYALQALNSTNATSASNALTASFVNPLRQTLTLTGSLLTRNTSSITTVAAIGRSGSLYIDLNGAGNNYLDGNVLYVRNSAGTSNVATIAPSSTILSSTSTSVGGTLNVTNTTTLTGSLYMRRADGPVLLRVSSSLSSSISSSIIPTTASFEGTITFTPSGAPTVMWNTDLDIYYSGNSGSGHTELSPVSNHISDSSMYDNFNITLDKGITLTPGGSIPDDNYTIWVYASGSINKWFQSTGNNINELSTLGINIPLSGGTTNDTFEADIELAGFAEVSDPNPYNNNINFVSQSTVEFTSSLFQVNAASSITGSIITSGSFTSIGNVTITGSLTVSGSTILTNVGTATFSGSTNISGSTTLRGTTVVTGSLYIASSSGDFYIYGNKQGNYGVFQDLTTQSGSANVSQSFKFNTIDESNGVKVTGSLSSSLYFQHGGTYDIQFSAQLFTTTGANVSIWLKKNGTNVAGSAGRLLTSNNDYRLPSWNYVISLVAGDTIDLVWQSDQANTVFQYITGSGNIPSAASIIISAIQVR